MLVYKVVFILEVVSHLFKHILSDMKLFFSILVLILIFGSYLGMFRDYSRLCAHELFLVDSGDHSQCWGSN